MTHLTKCLFRCASALLPALLLSACGLIPWFGEQPPETTSLPANDAKIVQCHQVIDRFDAQVADSGVRDAQEAAVAGYPQYRFDRFLASYAGQFSNLLEVSPQADHWLNRMYGLADKAARIEWRNLPATEQARLTSLWGLTDSKQAGGLTLLRSCLQRLHHASRTNARAVVRLARRISVPDEYSETSRILGAYWLTRALARSGLTKWQEEMHQRFATTTPNGIELVPPGASERLDVRQLGALLAAAQAGNPLGIPDPDASALRTLSQHYAPQLRVEMRNGADSVSTLRWGRDGELETLITRPTGYVLPSWTRWHGKALLQLNYLYWFPRRAESEILDPYAGRLDGIFWRVTLDEQGHVLFYDSIHPCGCYHTLYPVSTALKPAATEHEEPVLVYDGAPDAADTRIELQISSGDHQVLAVRKAARLVQAADSIMPDTLRKLGIGDQDRIPYDLRDYSELRTLPLPEGGHRSLFDSSGIVPGTERRERYYLWPMGVPKAGSMRQWGHHATAFTSRRHFDDADLMARLFE